MTLFVDRTIAESYFSALDRHFADFMVELAGETSQDRQRSLWLAASLVSASVGRGHVCLNLREIAGQPVSREEDGEERPLLVCPKLDDWINSLREQSVVGSPGEFKPLVLDKKQRLYLYRYWFYEQQLAESILAMAKEHPLNVDVEILAEGLKRFFPDTGEATNWQCIAAIHAVMNRFTVISGGPGTGKTHTVGRILALLIEQAKDDPPAIALAAPTGKAAARLTDMVRAIKEDLDCSSVVKALIPEKASTIHRLLGTIYGGKTFRHNKSNPLPFDIIVVDEASMVDLPLMAKLASALHESSRLLLLGDKDQLASVEPGAAFGDICDGGSTNTFSGVFAETVKDLLSVEVPQQKIGESALTDSIVVLQKSYRFGTESGIGLLASAVKESRLSDALDLLKGKEHDDVFWRHVPPVGSLGTAVEECFYAFYADYFSTRSPEEAMFLFDRFRLLCALRYGPYGASALNQTIEHMCQRAGLIPAGDRWYKCRPVMITRNDYHLKLFNGDVGIVFPDQETGGQLRVYFPADGGGFRRILPGRIKEHETVYAMTVHKSQGSEFDRVVLLLPDRPSRVVTRELVYTAITRAKKSVEVWGTEDVLRQGLSQTTRRESGLRDMLYGGKGSENRE